MHTERGPLSLAVMYSLILVLGALKVCMVLLNGVEDHVADAAGVTAAQPWRDTDRGTKFPVRMFAISAHSCLRKQQLPKCFQQRKFCTDSRKKVLFLTLHCRLILLIRVHLQKI